MSLRFETAKKDYQCNLCGKLSKHGAIGHAYDEHNRYVGDSCRKCDGFWTVGSQKQNFIPIPKSEKKQTKRFKVDTTTIRFTDYDHGEFLQGNDKRQCTRLEDGNWYWGGGVSSGLRHIGNISKTNSIHNAKTIIITEGYSDSKTVNEYYHNNPDYFACFIHGQKKHIYSELLATKELIFIHDIDKTGERERDNFVKQYPHTKVITHSKYNFETVGKKDITELVAEGWDIQEVVDTAYNPNHVFKKTVDQRYIKIPENNLKFNIIQSATGTGKTTEAIRYGKELGTLLHISGRERISQQVAEKHDMTFYKEDTLAGKHGQYKELLGHSTTCYDSLYKLKDLDEEGVVLVVDETSLILERIDSSDKNNKNKKVFQQLLIECKKIIITDAKIHNDFFTLLKEIYPDYQRKGLFLKNIHMPKENCKVTQYRSKEYGILKKHIGLALEAGKKIAIASDTKLEAEKLASGICKKYGSTKLITGETKKEASAVDVSEFQTVIYTQATFVGIDWNYDEERIVFFIGKNFITTSEDVRQAIARFRKATEYHIYMKGGESEVGGKTKQEIKKRHKLNNIDYQSALIRNNIAVAQQGAFATPILDYQSTKEMQREARSYSIENLLRQEGMKHFWNKDKELGKLDINYEIATEIRHHRMEFLNTVITQENCKNLEHYNDMHNVVSLKRIRDVIDTVTIDKKIIKNNTISIKDILEVCLENKNYDIKHLPKAILNYDLYYGKNAILKDKPDSVDHILKKLNNGMLHNKKDIELQAFCIHRILQFAENNENFNYNEDGQILIDELVEYCEGKERFERVLTKFKVHHITKKLMITEMLQNILRKSFKGHLSLKLSLRTESARFYVLAVCPTLEYLHMKASNINHMTASNNYKYTNNNLLTKGARDLICEVEISDKHAFLMHGEEFLHISPYIE